jgi:hypothetical protein
LDRVPRIEEPTVTTTAITARQIRPGDRLLLWTPGGDRSVYRVETTRTIDTDIEGWDCFTVLTRESDGRVARRGFGDTTTVERLEV